MLAPSAPAPADLDALADALARLLASWWRKHGTEEPQPGKLAGGRAEAPDGAGPVGSQPHHDDTTAGAR